MTTASMSLHRGAREVTRTELEAVLCPTASEGSIWRPVPHSTVLTMALQGLAESGYEVDQMQLAVARDDQRFWGTMVLKTTIVPGVSLAVAVASSVDKSLSLRWGFGHRVWICSNGAWSMEKTISRKHTVNGVLRYQEAIMRAVGELEQYREIESVRINRMIHTSITDQAAEAHLLRLYEDEKILSPRTLPTALQEWRDPSFIGFEDKSLWRLFNAVSFALQPRATSNPQAHAAATIRLGSLLSAEAPAAALFTQLG